MTIEQTFDQRANNPGFNIFLSYSPEDDRKAAEAGFVFLGAGPALDGGEVHIFQKCDLTTIRKHEDVPTKASLAARGLKQVNKPVSVYYDWLQDTWSAVVLHTDEDAAASQAYQDFAGTAVVQAIVPVMADSSGIQPVAFVRDAQRPAYLRFMDRARDMGHTSDEAIQREAREMYKQYLAGPDGTGEAVKNVDALISSQMKAA